MFAAIVGRAWATAAHPFNLEINGTDFIASIDYSTIDVEMPGPGSNGSMSFTLSDPTTSLPTVNEWDEVRFIEHAATRPILFGGFVQSVRFIAWAAGGRSIEVTCVGYGILLDKKVVPSFDQGPDAGMMTAAVHMISLVGRVGGLLWASRNPTNGGPSTEVYTVPRDGGEWMAGAYASLTFSTPCTLRDALQAIISRSYQADVNLSPMTAVLWADSTAGVRMLPTWTVPSVSGNDSIQYDTGALPALAIAETGAFVVERLEYEREDTDRVTSAYVTGSTPEGTGYFRRPTLERAGDLELLVSATDSAVATDILVAGGPALTATESATGSGTVTISADVPIDIWPGVAIGIDVPRLGLAASQFWRATSTRIRFRSPTSRTYEIGFGGNVPQRLMSRRQGRFATLETRA